jgi:hypothetical protein
MITLDQLSMLLPGSEVYAVADLIDDNNLVKAKDIILSFYLVSIEVVAQGKIVPGFVRAKVKDSEDFQHTYYDDDLFLDFDEACEEAIRLLKDLRGDLDTIIHNVNRLDQRVNGHK